MNSGKTVGQKVGVGAQSVGEPRGPKSVCVGGGARAHRPTRSLRRCILITVQQYTDRKAR